MTAEQIYWISNDEHVGRVGRVCRSEGLTYQIDEGPQEPWQGDLAALLQTVDELGYVPEDLGTTVGCSVMADHELAEILRGETGSRCRINGRVWEYESEWVGFITDLREHPDTQKDFAACLSEPAIYGAGGGMFTTDWRTHIDRLGTLYHLADSEDVFSEYFREKDAQKAALRILRTLGSPSTQVTSAALAGLSKSALNEEAALADTDFEAQVVWINDELWAKPVGESRFRRSYFGGDDPGGEVLQLARGSFDLYVSQQIRSAWSIMYEPAGPRIDDQLTSFVILLGGVDLAAVEGRAAYGAMVEALAKSLSAWGFPRGVLPPVLCYAELENGERLPGVRVIDEWVAEAICRCFSQPGYLELSSIEMRLRWLEEGTEPIDTNGYVLPMDEGDSSYWALLELAWEEEVGRAGSG